MSLAPIIDLLRSPNFVLVEQALQELADVAATEEGVGTIKESLSDIIPALHSALASPHEPLVMLSCWFISNISALSDEAVREQMCDEKILELLSEVLRRKFDDIQTKETALWAITNLSLSGTVRASMSDSGLRSILTQLFLQGDPVYRPKAIQAIRNFLADDEYCLEFYESEALSPTISLLESDDATSVEMTLAVIVILSEALEGLPLELVDTFNIIERVVRVMKHFDEDAIQELSLQLALHLFLSGEVDGPICVSKLIPLATERLNFLSRGIQHRAIAFLSHASVNSAARDSIKSNPQWASMTLTITAAATDSVQESALRLIANMSVDSACRRLLREKTNSVKILTALSQNESLGEESLELCKLALSNLNFFDPSDPNDQESKRVSFREARPSTSTFSVLSTGDRITQIKSDETGESVALSYPGDPRLSVHKSSAPASAASQPKPTEQPPLPSVSAFQPPRLKESDIVESTEVSQTSPQTSAPSAAATASTEPTAAPPTNAPWTKPVTPKEFSPSVSSEATMADPNRSLPSSNESQSGPVISHLPLNQFASLPIDGSIEKQLKQRDSIAQELLLTETAYLATLNAIQNTFVVPLRQAASTGKPVLMDSEIFALFSVTEVICSLHGQFYVKLSERMAPATWNVAETCLGDIFYSYAPRFLKAYKSYIANFDEALTLLNNDVLWKRKEWIQFFRTACKFLPDLNITGLAHFLIQPLARVPRYIVLLESILQFTPASHPDVPTLAKAIEKVKETTDQLLGPLELAENGHKIVSVDLSISGLSHSLVDNSRRYIQEGPAFMVVTSADDANAENATKGTTVYLFLFNDVLVVAKSLNDKEPPSTPSPTMSRARSATITASPVSTRFRAIFSLSLVDMTNAYVPDEDPEECKLSLACGQTQSTESALQLNPSNEFSSFAGDLTLIFANPSERDDWLNSISRMRNSTMAKVMRARKDSQTALAANDDVAAMAAHQVLRKPPFIVKRNLAKAMEWRESSSADMITTYKTSKAKRSSSDTPVQVGTTGKAAQVTKKSLEQESNKGRTKSFGLAALSSVSSAISKARRSSSSKKMTRMPVSSVKSRLESSSQTLETCDLHVPMATENQAVHQLMSEPSLVCTYRNSGSIGLFKADAPAGKVVVNDSKIITYRIRQPFVLSLHEDMRIQVHNAETGKSEFYSALLGIPEAQASNNFRPRAATLICDWNRVIVILTMGGVYKVVVYRFTGASPTDAPIGIGPQPSCSMTHEATSTLFMPMDTLARAAYAMVPTHKFCKLSGENLLLGCYDQWQVWSLVTTELVHFDTNNLDGAITTFTELNWVGDYIAAASSDDVYVWSLEQRQRIYSVRTGFIVTSLYLDDKGVIIGGNDGQLFLRSHSKEHKTLLSADVPRTPDSGNFSSKSSFENKVSDVCRIRWRNVEFVLAVCEASGVHMWHPASSNQIKHWKSKGHYALSCVHLHESVRLLIRKRSSRISMDASSPRQDLAGSSSFEIWQVNLKFLDKWLSEHMDVLDPSSQKSPRGQATSGAQPTASSTLSSTSSSTEVHDSPPVSVQTAKSMTILPLAIPNTLGTRFFPWLRTLLVRTGVLVTMYRGVGSVMLRSDSTSVVIENPNPIVAWTKRQNIFMTLHRDGNLQLIDITKNAVTSSFQAKAMVQVKDSSAAAPGIDVAEDDSASSEMIPEPSYGTETDLETTFTPGNEKEQSVILLADADSQNFVIVRAYESRYVVWQLQVLSAAIVTSVRKLACVPPKGPGLSVPILKLEPSLCSYWNGHLVLGSRQELQVWNVEAASLVKSVAAPSLAQPTSAPQTFGSVMTTGKWAFATVGDSVMVVQLTDSGDMAPKVAFLSLGTPVSDMLACPDCLLLGTSDGMMFALALQKMNSEDVSISDLLARAAEINFARSAMQHPSFAVRKQEGVQRRVNCVVRKGRLIFAGHEGNCITVWSYDPYLMGASQPIFIKEFVTKSSVLSLEIRQSSVSALVRASSVSIGTVALELLVLNIAPLLTSSGIRNTVAPNPLAPTTFVTFDVSGEKKPGATPANFESSLALLQQHATTTMHAVRQVADTLKQSPGSATPPNQLTLASIHSQLQQAVDLLAQITRPSESDAAANNTNSTITFSIVQ